MHGGNCNSRPEIESDTLFKITQRRGVDIMGGVNEQSGIFIQFFGMMRGNFVAWEIA